MANLERLQANLERHGFHVVCFPTAGEAADYLDRKLDGRTIGMGGSMTIQELGLMERLAAHNTFYSHWSGATHEQAAELRALLAPGILAVGVFVDAAPEDVAALLNAGLIDAAQLHGHEDGAYIRRLRALTKAPLIQAFRMDGEGDVRAAEASAADFVLLDAGNGGTGSAFDWSLARKVRRPYFLAGGLAPENVGAAFKRLSPYGVDVSSGIETDGYKDAEKMAAFAAAVRKEERL